MVKRASLFLSVAATVALVRASQAQSQVWIVAEQPGPGVNYTDIQPAVDAAAPGDIVLVEAGAYHHFTLDGKGLSILAEAGAEVSLNKLTCCPLYTVVSNLPAGQSVVLRGLQFGSAPTPWAYALELEDDQGPVWIEDCKSGGAPGVTVSNCSSVSFVSCTLLATGTLFLPGESPIPAASGLRAQDSSIWLYDTTILGGNGATGKNIFQQYVTFPGAAGASIDGGTLLASRSTIQGGNGGPGAYDAVPGLCIGPGNGGPGVWLESGSPSAYLVASTIQGGAGGVPVVSCPSASAGTDVQISSGSASSLPGAPPKLVANSPVREGQTLQLDWSGQAGDLAFILAGGAQGAVPLPAFSGVLLVGQPLALVALGGVPSAGTLGLSIVISELGAGTLGALAHVQSASCSTSGSCLLGSPSVTLLLDSSL